MHSTAPPTDGTLEHMKDPDDLRLFVYGTLLSGEKEHASLATAERLGPGRTAPRYTLVDLGVYPALVATGATAVSGELYRIDRGVRFTLDVKWEVPILFYRVDVELEGGDGAEAYLMAEDKVRGKRRIWSGDWRRRFEPRPNPNRPKGFGLK